jgi:hypothetical protein
LSNRLAAARSAAEATVIGHQAAHYSAELYHFVEEAMRFAVGRCSKHAATMAMGAAVKAWEQYAKAMAVCALYVPLLNRRLCLFCVTPPFIDCCAHSHIPCALFSSLLFSSLLFSSLYCPSFIIKKLIETCKSFQVEPSFFKRLKEELSHDEMIELLHQSPDQAKKFGLSKKKFKQLQEYSTYLGII